MGRQKRPLKNVDIDGWKYQKKRGGKREYLIKIMTTLKYLTHIFDKGGLVWKAKIKNNLEYIIQKQ